MIQPMDGDSLKFGIIGSGSWATALVKILSDNNNKTNWWVRNGKSISYIKSRKHNPQYLSSAYFDVSLLNILDTLMLLLNLLM